VSAGERRASAWEEVYALVRRIPRGRVMSYGQIAGLLRRPLSARAVGWAMRQCPESVPWQRVVNASGGISTEHLHEPRDLQRRLLEREGVRFGPDGTLPMARYRWAPRGRAGRRARKK
jgi:methylated-DNA-protein-cysteine methyltransferase-like protein